MEKLGQKWKARLVSTNGFHLIDHDENREIASALTFTAEHHMIYYLLFLV